MLIEHEEICRLIPHAGNMCLLAGVESWDENHIHCVAKSHRDPRNPLRRLDVLSAVCGLEYGAQTMALHGALLGRIRGKMTPVGFLAAIRKARFQVDCLHDIDGDLHIEAAPLMSDTRGYIYQFVLRSSQRELVTARATVMFID